MFNPFEIADRRTHLRLFPQIEKIPSLQAFVETYPGRMLLALTFGAVFSSFQADFYSPMDWAEAAGIFIFAVLPLKTAVKVFLGTLAMVSRGLPRDFGSSAAQSGQRATVHQMYINFVERLGDLAPLHYAAAFLIAASLALLCLWALRLFRARLAAVWLFAVWCGFLYAALATSPQLNIYPAVWISWGIFSLSLFSLAYYHASGAKAAPVTALSFNLQTFFIQPPFTVIRHPSLLEGSSISPAVCRLKALKLLVWTRLLAFLLDGIRFLFFQKLGLENFNWLGLAEFNAHALPWYEVFGARLVQTLCLLLYLSVHTGIAISLFRLAGVYLPRAVCRPYLARSFNDYYRRCFFYYSETIVHLFFYPLYEKAYTAVSSRKWRLQIALFLSLLIGGWIFHVVLTWQNFFFFGAKAAWENALGWLPYFTSVAICCCISQTGWIHTRLRTAPLAVHCLLNLILHSLLMTFMQYSVGESLHERFNFFRSMLPF